MKKLLILLFLIALSIACFAEGETYATAGDLYQAWAESFPDYISGVWSTDGTMTNLTFSVVNGDEGEKGKAEILALVEDDYTVTFANGDFSRNYLTHVQDELLPYFEKGIGLVSSGVYDMENRIGLGILTEKKDSPETLAMLEELKEKYGDVFFIEYTDGIAVDLPLEGLVTVVNRGNTARYIAFVIAGALVLAFATFSFVIVLKKRHN